MIEILANTLRSYLPQVLEDRRDLDSTESRFSFCHAAVEQVVSMTMESNTLGAVHGEVNNCDFLAGGMMFRQSEIARHTLCPLRLELPYRHP